MAKLNGSKLAPEILARRIGKIAAADLVLIGWVFRFRERIGTAWGAYRPAAIAFTAYLFSVDERTVLWQGKYDESQNAFYEDATPFFRYVKRAGKWETARQMATGAVAELLVSFPTMTTAE